MAKAWQEAGGLDSVQRQNPSKKTLETLWPVVGGTDPTLRRFPLRPIAGGTYPTLRKSHDVGGTVDQERCIPIPWWTAIRPKAVGIGQTYVLMAVGVQQMGDILMAACTWYPGDDLDSGAIHPPQWKKTKRQWMGNKFMIVDTQCADFGPWAEADLISGEHNKWVKV